MENWILLEDVEFKEVCQVLSENGGASDEFNDSIKNGFESWHAEVMRLESEIKNLKNMG